jgi:hypothetical protein
VRSGTRAALGRSSTSWLAAARSAYAL